MRCQVNKKMQQGPDICTVRHPSTAFFYFISFHFHPTPDWSPWLSGACEWKDKQRGDRLSKGRSRFLFWEIFQPWLSLNMISGCNSAQRGDSKSCLIERVDLYTAFYNHCQLHKHLDPQTNCCGNPQWCCDRFTANIYFQTQINYVANVWLLSGNAAANLKNILHVLVSGDFYMFARILLLNFFVITVQ